MVRRADRGGPQGGRLNAGGGPRRRRQPGNSGSGHGGRVIPHGRHISEPTGGEGEGHQGHRGGGGETEETV